MNSIFGYPEDMDVEMIPLCEILNQFRGIDTLYSCCGHDGEKGFYISLVCTAENLEDLFRIFPNDKFEFDLFDKYADESNKEKIMDIETKTDTKRILIGIYKRDDSHRDDEFFSKVSKEECREICEKAIRLLATRNPEKYYKFKSILNELVSSTVSLLN